MTEPSTSPTCIKCGGTVLSKGRGCSRACDAHTYGAGWSDVTANIHTVDGPGIPLYRVTLDVRDVGVFAYRPIKSIDAATAIAKHAVAASPYDLSMMLCSKGWRKQ